jgi:acyl-CoA synthetase (AMP-forming)/AMP-acid ligase II
VLAMTMDYFLRRALRQHASKTALVAGGRRYSYGEIDCRSSRLAAALSGLGLARGDRLAILLGITPAFFETEIAAAKAGLVKVPINTRLSGPEIAHVLRSCGARAVVVDGLHSDMVCGVASGLPQLSFIISDREQSREPVYAYERLIERGRDDFGVVQGSYDDLYSMRYSGGTTGEPKGIMHTAAAYVAIALSVLREYEVGYGDRAVQVTHPAHGANFVWPALFARGNELHLLERYDPEAILRTIESEHIERITMVPSMWYGVLDHPKFRSTDFSSVTTCAYISAPMAVERVRQALELLGPRLMNVYTLSESPVVTTLLKKQDHVLNDNAQEERRLGSCGREAEDVQVRIVDDAGTEVRAGEVGEITISSPGNMCGYWKNPALTAGTLRDGWVWTGDMARRDEYGFIYLVDRRSEMIVTGGFNVYPREVEEVLYLHPAVREASVAGIPDAKWGEAVTAFVSLHQNASCSEQELLALCETRLAHYKKPKMVQFLADLPKTSAGKISRRALTDQYWADRERRIG